MRSKVRELEARLRSTGKRKFFGGPSGKLEYTLYENGSVDLTFLCSGLDLVDGSTLQVLSEDHIVLEARLEGGSCRINLEGGDASALPDLKRFDEIQVLHGDQALLVGHLVKD